MSGVPWVVILIVSCIGGAVPILYIFSTIAEIVIFILGYQYRQRIRRVYQMQVLRLSLSLYVSLTYILPVPSVISPTNVYAL